MTLSVEPVPGLVLRDPFMIASSHLTESENALKQFAPYEPSALTLKTTSSLGGDGRSGLSSRIKVLIKDAYGRDAATFTDGPKSLELLDVPTTVALTRTAERILPTTAIGLSVLFGEDYASLAQSLRPQDYRFVELNLKYAFREIAPNVLGTLISDYLEDFDRFVDAYGSRPLLVKLSREATQLLRFADFRPLLQRVRKVGAALVVANSLRTVVPRSRTEKKNELSSGVIVGEHLFLDTYDTIRMIHQQATSDSSRSRLIASGGIIDVADVLDIMAAGAEAVQLCTAFDRRGVRTLSVLRSQLKDLCQESGSLSEYLSTLRSSDRAWTDGVTKAHSIRATDHHEVRRRLDHETHELAHTKAALELECQAVRAVSETSTIGDIPADLRFVLTCGTASSCLLVHLLTDEYFLAPVHFDEVSTFMKRLKDPTFSWDFAILSESHLRYLATQKANAIAAGPPQRVEEVASAHWQLMGVGGVALQDIKTIYHFGGTGARAALTKLLGQCQATPELIRSQMLHPILRYWDRQDAIIAKPPVSQIYATFCPSDIAANWTSLWSTKEPLILVINEQRLQTDGGKALAGRVAAALHKVRAYVLEDTSRAARRLRATGFFQYCVRLLGFKALGVEM